MEWSRESGGFQAEGAASTKALRKNLVNSRSHTFQVMWLESHRERRPEKDEMSLGKLVWLKLFRCM